MESIAIKNLSRPEWLALRKKGIGGSEVAAILGLSPWKSPLDVYLKKTSTEIEDIDTPAMYWGRALEDLVAKEFQSKSGLKIQRCNMMFIEGHSVGNIDRMICLDGKSPVVKGEVRTDAILECKTASEYMASSWGPEETDEIPDQYLCQVQHYMGITGASVCRIAVLIGGRDFRTYTVRRDSELIGSLQENVERFWRDYVETMTPPPPRSSDDIAKLFPRSATKEVMATAEIEEAVSCLAEVKSKAKALEKAQQELEEKVKLSMGACDTLVNPAGKVLCSWKSNKDSVKTDWQAVAVEAGVTPEIISRHTKTTPGARPLKLKEVSV
jgi:putative phage-type endonuclease